MNILNDCSLILHVDVIKQKGGDGAVVINLRRQEENILIDSHREKTNSKLNLVRASCSGPFKKGDTLHTTFVNGKDIRVTIFGIGN